MSKLIGIEIGCIRLAMRTEKSANYLCELDLKRTAARVDITTVQRHSRTLGRLDRVELDHRLTAILLKNHNTQHFAIR